MKYTENEMKEILSQKLELSDQVEERLQETYSQIRMENKAKPFTQRSPGVRSLRQPLQLPLL